jgi:hypothetical protein
MKKTFQKCNDWQFPTFLQPMGDGPSFERTF